MIRRVDHSPTRPLAATASVDDSTAIRSIRTSSSDTPRAPSGLVTSTARAIRGSLHMGRATPPAADESDSWLPVDSKRTFVPACVSTISSVPHARPAAGRPAATAAGTNQGSMRPTSACHWSLPRTRSTKPVEPPARSGIQESPPVRNDSVAVRISPDEMSTCPVLACMRPAAVTTTRGSMISRPCQRAVNFSISPPARCHCHASPCGETAAAAVTLPESSRPAIANEGTTTASRGCHVARSPTSEHSAVTLSAFAAGRTAGTFEAALKPNSDQQSTNTPPETAASSLSSPHVSTPRACSIAAAADVTLPVPSASSVMSASRHTGRPGRASSSSAMLADTFSDRPLIPGSLPTSIRPRERPLAVAEPRSSSSASSPTSPPISAVHCTASAAGVPAADSSTALETSRASSTRRRSSRPGPLRPLSHAVKGSGQVSCRSRAGGGSAAASSAASAMPWRAARSRALARSSSSRSSPSARAVAANRRLPPDTRTSGRTISPPGRPRDAAARSTSSATVKSSPTISSAQRRRSSCGSRRPPNASARNIGDVAANRRTMIRPGSSEKSNGITHRSIENRSSSATAPQTASWSIVASPCTCRPAASSVTSSRRSAMPSSTCDSPNLVATTLDAPSGSLCAATVTVRAPLAATAGDESDQPPSRTSTAAAAAGIVERSSRTGSVVAAVGAAAAEAVSRRSECRSRPAAVQPESRPSARSVPAAITSVSRQASLRTTSLNSTVAPKTSSSKAGAWPVDASQVARMSSRELPSLRTSTSASGSISLTVPRFDRSIASRRIPRSITIRGTITTARPARSRSTTSRYSMPSSQPHVAPVLVMLPSMPEKATASGRSRRDVCTSAAGASHAATPRTARVTSAEATQRRRGRSSLP